MRSLTAAVDVGAGLGAARIVNPDALGKQLTEIARALLGGSDAVGFRHRVGFARNLRAHEKERPVLDERAAERTARLVALRRRHGRAGGRKVVAGGKGRIPVELKQRAVQGVGAGTGRYVDDAARKAPVFGRQHRGLHVELGNRVDDRLVGLKPVADVVFRQDRADAVQLNF